VCPCITCPQNYGLEIEENTVAQRSLILVSKLIINLVNGIEFDGSKEEYMVGLNCFIQKNSSNLQRFFDNRVDPDLLAEDETLAGDGAAEGRRSFKVLVKALDVIHKSLLTHKDHVWDQLLQHPHLMPKFKDLFFYALASFDFTDN